MAIVCLQVDIVLANSICGNMLNYSKQYFQENVAEHAECTFELNIAGERDELFVWRFLECKNVAASWNNVEGSIEIQ